MLSPIARRLFGLRVDEPLVAADQHVADILDLLAEFVELPQLRHLRASRVNRFLQLLELVLQEVHLAEHVLLLILREQRPLVEVRHLGRHVFRSVLAEPLRFKLVVGGISVNMPASFELSSKSGLKM